MPLTIVFFIAAMATPGFADFATMILGEPFKFQSLAGFVLATACILLIAMR